MKSGLTLRNLRLKTGLTQDQVGAKLKLASRGQYISNIECGRTTLPVHHVPKLSQLYKVSQRKLLDLYFRSKYTRKVNKNVYKATTKSR